MCLFGLVKKSKRDNKFSHNKMRNWISCCVLVPAPPGSLTKIGSDPVQAVNDALEESANVVSVIFKFAASLIAPEEDEGTVSLQRFRSWYIRTQVFHTISSLCSSLGNLYAVRKKGLYHCCIVHSDCSLLFQCVAQCSCCTSLHVLFFIYMYFKSTPRSGSCKSLSQGQILTFISKLNEQHM